MAYGDDQIDGYSEGEEPMVFHYRKGSFRDREPQKYRDLATGQNQPKKGLFRSLVSTKANRTIFIGLCACVFLVFMISILSGHENQSSINGMNFEMTCFSFEENVYASVSVKPDKKKSELTFNEPLHAVFYAVNTDGTVCDKYEEDFLFDGSELFMRASFRDYDVEKVTCDITNGEQQKHLESSVAKH